MKLKGKTLSCGVIAAALCGGLFAQDMAPDQNPSAPSSPSPGTPSTPSTSGSASVDQSQASPATDSTAPSYQSNLAVGAEPIVGSPASVPSPFDVGPFVLKPHASYSFVDARGLLAAPGDIVDTTIQTFSPGLGVDFGKDWSFDYTASWVDYSSRAYGDSFDQYATLKWDAHYEAWDYFFLQKYSKTNEVLVETGQQTPQNQYQTQLGANYALNSVSSVDLEVEQDVDLSEIFSSSRQWVNNDSYHYLFGAGLDGFGSASVGYTTVRPGFDSSFERFQVGSDWKPSQDFTLSAEAGIERRVVAGLELSAFVNGIFSGSVNYTPVDGTQLGLTLSRYVEDAFTSNEIVRLTSGNFTVSQRLFKYFYSDGAIGLTQSHYLDVFPEPVPSRDDRYLTYSLGIGTTLLRRASIEIRYSHARNNSNTTIYSFDSNQYEFDVSIRY